MDIYGCKYGYSDVERLLANVEIQTFETRYEQEVAGYAEVMESIFASFDAIAPTENHIKQLHRDLLAQSSKEAKIERENLLIVNLPELSVQILELAKAHGRITVSQIVGMAGANRNTVKKYLQALISASHLAQHGSGKGTWYVRV